MSTPNEIIIDGTVFVPITKVKDSDFSDLPFVLVRCRDAGVHAGYLESKDPNGDIVLRDSRRIWYWSGAASLSELAVYGANNPDACKFGVALNKNTLRYSDACEEIACTPESQKMIQDCKEWRA